MELLRRFVEGDIAAFETIFRDTEHDIYRWLLRMVRDPAIAEDLVVETFWPVYRSRATFDWTQSFQAWARRIATNVARDHLRRRLTEVALPEALAASSQPDPAVSQDIARKVRQAIAALPPKHRIVVLLAVVEELPYREIAEALAVPVGTVKSRVFHAMRLLRRKRPTIKARVGRTTVVRHTNELGMPTVVHLHGGVTPPESDGFPTDHIMPGLSRTYTYPNEGRAATLWYHDHAMDHTGRNIYIGLAGLYVLEDRSESALHLPAGAFDIPLVIQDRLFDADGAFVYDTFHGLAAKGGVMLVNGAPWPRLEVSTRKYRFRILNASNATPLRLPLSSGRPLIQVATDGGLLPVPMTLPKIPVAMAERVEVVIDFGAYPVGAEVILQNLSDSDISGRVSDEIMRFDVARSEEDDSAIPARLSDMRPVPGHAAMRTRRFVFAGGPELRFPPVTHWTINGSDFQVDRPVATPRYGDVEIWHFENRKRLGFLGLVHPVHVHLVNFQVIERDGGPPPPHETGWKDTVAITSSTRTTR